MTIIMHEDESPACSGPCDQGRKPCPTPEACEMNDADIVGMAKGLVIAVALVAAAIGCASLIVWAGGAQ